jgi:hypothetical protein
MRRCDAVIVGGGPAGSSCAWALRRAGRDVVVVDRAAFPRDKICAGWITPAVVASLEIDVADFRRGRTFQPITGFRTGRIRGRHVETRYPEPISFGIRRCEFDHYLLCRSGAEVRPDTPVASLRREGERWIVNDAIEAPVLVGPAATSVRWRATSGGAGAPSPSSPAQEFEVPLDEDEHDTCPVRPEMPELYFARDFKGYGWCFRKRGVVNVGYGRFGGDGSRPTSPISWTSCARRSGWGSVSGRMRATPTCCTSRADAGGRRRPCSWATPPAWAYVAERRGHPHRGGVRAARARRSARRRASGGRTSPTRGGSRPRSAASAEGGPPACCERVVRPWAPASGLVLAHAQGRLERWFSTPPTRPDRTIAFNARDAEDGGEALEDTIHFSALSCSFSRPPPIKEPARNRPS